MKKQIPRVPGPDLYPISPGEGPDDANSLVAALASKAVACRMGAHGVQGSGQCAGNALENAVPFQRTGRDTWHDASATLPLRLWKAHPCRFQGHSAHGRARSLRRTVPEAMRPNSRPLILPGCGSQANRPVWTLSQRDGCRMWLRYSKPACFLFWA